MNSKEYINNAVRTESRDFEAIGKRLSEESNIRLLHGAIGLATESGEFLDALKKHIYYGKELDRVNLAEELFLKTYNTIKRIVFDAYNIQQILPHQLCQHFNNNE